MALLVLLKIAATSTSYASGNAGGIFGPSLFMGAMMGGAVGGLAHHLLPDYTGSVGAYALVGMGSAFAGIVRVPLTSVIMIFEITRDYSVIVPLMISNLISYFISSRLQKEPIYEALQRQDGIHLPSDNRKREALLLVGHGFCSAPTVLSAEMLVSQAVSLVDRERGAWPLVDESGLRGMITEAQLDEAVKEGAGDRALGDIIQGIDPRVELTADNFPHVHPDHSLELAMQRIARSGLRALPVVSRTNIRELKGTISFDDILSAYRTGGTDETPQESGRRTKAQAVLFGAVVVAFLAIATFPSFLNYFYRAERSARAQRHYQAGNELVRVGRYDDAVEQFRNALSISFAPEHRLALALALVRSGHFAEAGIYLKEFLGENPTSGPANLGLARAYVGEGRLDDAVGYFHRAIYGVWPEKATENREHTYLELIDALRRAGRGKQAQGELLSAVAEAPTDPGFKKQLARMLIGFGLPLQAADTFRELLQESKDDPGAWEGLGEAEFSQGNYEAAKQAFHTALELDPADKDARKLSETADEILGLDPNLQGLRATERFRRSRRILAGALMRFEECEGREAAAGARLQDAVKTAHKILGSAKRPRSYSDEVEANESLAEQLWSTMMKLCPAPPSEDDALSKVMSRIAHR